MRWKNEVAVRQYHLKTEIDRYRQELENIRKEEARTGIFDTFNEQATIFGLNSSEAEYQELNKPIYIGDITFVKTNKDIIVNELAQLLSEINNRNYVYRETVNESTNEKTFELVDEDNNDVLLLPDLENIEFSFQTSYYYGRKILKINIADYDKVATSKYTIVDCCYDGVAYTNYSIIMTFIIALNIESFLLERDLNAEEISKIRSKFIENYKAYKYFYDAVLDDSFFDMSDTKVYKKNIES